MILFKSLRCKNEKSGRDDFRIAAPLSGTVITLHEVGDGVFSEGILGDGCAIQPEDESMTLCAPFDGTVSEIPDTGHAVGLTNQQGAEVLLHIGIDTVELKGDGFHPRVSIGQKIKRGQPLLDFSKKKIEQEGYSAVVVIVVTNSSDYKKISLCHTGKILCGSRLLEVVS